MQEDIPQKLAQADEIGIIQTQLIPQGYDLIVGRIWAQHHFYRVAWREIHDGEDQDGHPQDHRNHLEESSQDISTHW